MDIGRFIRLEREKIGISSRKLSEKIGKSSSYISSIEIGHYKPDYSIVEEIFGALKIDKQKLKDFDLGKRFSVETIGNMTTGNTLEIILPDAVLEKLIDLSVEEFRTPEQQATKIIADYFKNQSS